MEKETGAKIIIRGKGSVKEGKVGRKDGQPLPGEDEPLHAYITATNADAVKKAVEKIKEVIRQGVEVPEGQNDLRRMQLRELAQLNGTLREHDQQRCANCTATDHKTWLCPDRPNVTSSVVCSSCGGAGHIARDCRARRPGHAPPGAPGAGGASRAKIDEEYLSLMAELGEAPPPGPAPRRMLPALHASHHPARALMPGPGLPPALPPPPGAFPPPPPPPAPHAAPWLGSSAGAQPPPPGSAAPMPPPAFPPPPPPHHQNEKLVGSGMVAPHGMPPPLGPPPPHAHMPPPPPGMMGMGWRGAFNPPPWAPPPAPPPPSFLAPPPPPPPQAD